MKLLLRLVLVPPVLLIAMLVYLVAIAFESATRAS